MVGADDQALTWVGGVAGSREVLGCSGHDRITWIASFLEPGVLTRFGLRREL